MNYVRELLAGIVFIIVLGIGGFFFRTILENPYPQNAMNGTQNSGAACSADARVCPDGSAVGRTGPDCTFAACPPPNAQIVLGSTTLAFVVPEGYSSAPTQSDPSIIGDYTQSAGENARAIANANVNNAGSGSSIIIHAYQIPEGETGSQIMLANTQFSPSGLTATSSSEFSNIQIGSNLFSEILIGDTNERVQSAYYLADGKNLFRFDVIEEGVTNWQDPSLNSASLPQHEALMRMLATLQISN